GATALPRSSSAPPSRPSSKASEPTPVGKAGVRRRDLTQPRRPATIRRRSLIALACSVPAALLGAYYLVNASAVNWLGNLEGQGVNRIRVRLRRVNGVVLLLMSVALYLGVSRLLQIRQGEPAGMVAPLAWIATLPLLLAMLVLAMLDV